MEGGRGGKRTGMVGTQMTIESGRGRVKVVDKPSLVGGVMGKPARKITLGHKWSECGFWVNSLARMRHHQIVQLA